MKNHFQQRLVHLNTAVVFDKPQSPESIHEEADSRARRPNHFRKRLLRDRRNLRFRFARLTILGHKEKNSGQTLLTGIEELIDEVGLAPHTSRQQKLYEQVRELMFAVHYTDHLFPAYFERRAGGDSGGRG